MIIIRPLELSSNITCSTKEKQFQKLPPDLQELVLQAGKEMQKYEHDLFLENEKSIQQVLKDKGMELVEVDTEAFAKKCEKAIYESLSPEMKDIYQELKKDQEEHAKRNR